MLYTELKGWAPFVSRERNRGDGSSGIVNRNRKAKADSKVRRFIKKFALTL